MLPPASWSVTLSGWREVAARPRRVCGGSVSLLQDEDGGGVNISAAREPGAGCRLAGGTEVSAIPYHALGPQQPSGREEGAGAPAWLVRGPGVGDSVVPGDDGGARFTVNPGALHRLAAGRPQKRKINLNLPGSGPGEERGRGVGLA